MTHKLGCLWSLLMELPPIANGCLILLLAAHVDTANADSQWIADSFSFYVSKVKPLSS